MGAEAGLEGQSHEAAATEQIELWNLAEGGTARTGCLDSFNVVGRVADVQTLDGLTYRLNGGPQRPVFVRRQDRPGSRLERRGEFNIDTIALTELQPTNQLLLSLTRDDGSEHRHTVNFHTEPFDQAQPRFRLDFDGVARAEEVGQIVEGPWRVRRGDDGRACLEILPVDAGYDRIILFGSGSWTSSYEVRARLTVTRIVGGHNVGLMFKWNPHVRGDGTRLPKTWSGGLAYYCSYGKHPGTRLRFGVEATYDEDGQISGNHLLAHRPLTTRRTVVLNKLKRRAGLAPWTTELEVGAEYAYRLLVHPRRLALTVRAARSGDQAPDGPPQLVVDEPIDPLPRGAVGVLAANVGVRVHEFEVRPVDDRELR